MSLLQVVRELDSLATIGYRLRARGKHNISIGELKALLKQLNPPKKSKLSNKLKKVKVISKASEVLYNYNFWSFFDYKILGAIITSFCFDLKPDFDEYVLNFKEYWYVKCQMIATAQNCPNQKKKRNYASKLTRILWRKSRS